VDQLCGGRVISDKSEMWWLPFLEANEKAGK
jgi:hypothetical protein